MFATAIRRNTLASSFVGSEAITARDFAAALSHSPELYNPEISTIATVFHQLTGQQIATDDIRSLAQEVEKSGSHVRDVISENRGQLPPGFDELILQAYHLVMLADGDVTDSESRLTGEIGGALLISRARQQEIADSVAGSERERST